jgi:hypothetical protein
MPQARPEIRALFADDGAAWEALKLNFSEFKFLIYPNKPGYKPTKAEADAIEYLCDEGDGGYDANFRPEEHARKMAVVHAVWLVSYMHSQKSKTEEKKLNTELVINDAAAMLGVEPDKLFQGFDDDWADRAWCSRPIDWKPQDSLNTV